MMAGRKHWKGVCEKDKYDFHRSQSSECELTITKESRQKVQKFLEKFPVEKHHIDQLKYKLAAAPTSNFKVIRSSVFKRQVPPQLFLTEKVERKRTLLPAFNRRKEIEESIRKNNVTFVIGGTGCGKTTQVPQYILEVASLLKKPVKIMCTQPRRLPAISISKRVAYERGEHLGGTVGYHIRLDQRTSEDTVLTFCTTGILLRMLSVPALVETFTHIILDEIHERGIETDCVLIALKQILKSRRELKVILMSATMEGSLEKLEYFFKEFSTARITIKTKLHDVREFYLPEILALIFREDDMLKQKGQTDSERKLFSPTVKAKEAFKNLCEVVPNRPQSFNRDIVEKLEKSENLNRDEIIEAYKNSSERRGISLVVRLVSYLLDSNIKGAILVFMPGIHEINLAKEEISTAAEMNKSSMEPLIFILHSEIDGADQDKIFVNAPNNCRKVILSTNIAEASVTIEDVVFVIDCGAVKRNIYDHSNMTSELKLKWTAKSNATQRKGRAGRCRNGYCFRLYTEQDFENMRDAQTSEMEVASLHDAVLHAKLFAPKGTSVKQFLKMAPEPPLDEVVDHSIEYLKDFGAICTEIHDKELCLTKLGEFVAHMPLDVQLSRMLLFGVMLKCMGPIVNLVAALALRDPYIILLEERDLAYIARDVFGRRDFSDHLMLIRILQAFSKCSSANSLTNEIRDAENEFCKEKYLNPSSMRMMIGIRSQLVSEMKRLKLLPSNVIDHNAPDYNTYSEEWPMVQAAIMAGSAIAKKVPEKNLRFQTGSKSSVILHPMCVLNRQTIESKHYEASIAQFAHDNRDPNIEFLAYRELVKLREGVVAKTVTVVPSLTALFFGGNHSILDSLIENITAIKSVNANLMEPLEKGAQISIVVTDWLKFSGDFNIFQSLSKLRFKVALHLSRTLEGFNSCLRSEHEDFLKCMSSVLSHNHVENYFDKCSILEKE